MKLVGNALHKFIKLTGDELCSSEEHFVYSYEISKSAEKKTTSSSFVRIVQRDDKFVSDYFKRLSAIFLERGEMGLGYYFNNLLVGFLWIRSGEFPEQVGRETIIVPSNYALLHHLVVGSEYRNKGIGTLLLGEFVSTFARNYQITKTIAFVRSDNIPSVKAFNSVGFVQQGLISSKKHFGKRIFSIKSPGIPLSEGPKTEYRSIVAQSMNFPIKILLTPYIHQEENLVDGVIGGRPWISILAATVLHDSALGVIHAVSEVGTPILLPCLVSPGKTVGKFRINIEPTSFQSWPSRNEHTYREIISAIAKVGQSRWIETLDWPLPFWISSYPLDIELPVGCNLVKINDFTWIKNFDESYETVERGFSRTARTYIRQSEKRGVVICDNPSEEDLRNFADLWLESYESRNWGGMQYSRFFFLVLNKYISKRDASIVLAKVNGSVVAGGVFVRDALGYIYLLGAVDRNYDHFRPMYAVLNHIIKKAVKLGVNYINLGGTGGRDNLEYFKKHWGAQPKELYWLRCNNFVQRTSILRRLFDKSSRILETIFFRLVGYVFRRIILRDI